MDYNDWARVYEAILADFGYPQSCDEAARDRLATLLNSRSTFDLESLAFERDSVAIAGGAPSLTDDIELVADADAVIAVSTAADRLLEQEVGVDLVVTDLDKHPETVARLTRSGTPVAVHAHGDNVDLVAATVPGCDPAFVVPTTQAEPAGSVRNFGGFTDGDLAAFLADHFGAASLSFPGWDFDDATVTAEKARKLDWAERLLYWLERWRDERFAVLDGRRNAIDTSTLPVE